MNDIVRFILDFSTKCKIARVEPGIVLVHRGWRDEFVRSCQPLMSRLVEWERDYFGPPIMPDWDVMYWGVKIRFV